VASRGSVNNIILKSLVNGDKYGYEIIKDVENFSDGKIILKQPSLYSSLSRFEDKKYVTSYWGDSDIGGRRHYYHLTELGLQYYKKAVLKESDENDEDFDENDNEDIVTLDNSDLDESNNNELSVNTEDDIIYNEISEEEIPAIADFDSPKENVIIPDHEYLKSTPMENMICNQVSNNVPENIQEISQPENVANTTNPEPWIQLSNSVKQSNAKVSKTNYNKLYFKKPKKEQRVILDKDGIYKLRDEDYIPEKRNTKPIIIDNVGKRTKSTNVYDYSTYSENKPKTQNTYTELTEEEKRKRNENFLAKFNLLTNSKMKPISSPAPKVEEKKPEIEKPIDYRGKLNAIIESNIIEDEDPVVDLEENNLFNYTEEDNWSIKNSPTPDKTDEEEDDNNNNLIDLEPTQEFETKTENTQYIKEINQFSTSSSQIQINKYENKQQAILVDKTFVLINKLKFVFGIILTLLMIAEITIAYFLFKNNNLISENDSIVLIISYVIIALFAGIYILPYCFNKNQHKANNFKFKYAIWFGILTFLVLTILIYCVNAFNGFELDNFKYFAVKLIIPFILSFNFVLGPIIYGLLNKNKIFYD
ncbi:MAG: helix-turn-helix transcriptional regulator, partial [Christensenellales bacterium]